MGRWKRKKDAATSNKYIAFHFLEATDLHQQAIFFGIRHPTIVHESAGKETKEADLAQGKLGRSIEGSSVILKCL
jgi:hypothetical protein